MSKVWQWQAKPYLKRNEIEKLVDPRLEDAFDDMQIRRLAFAASLCIRSSTTWRPTMTQVLPFYFNTNYYMIQSHWETCLISGLNSPFNTKYNIIDSLFEIVSLKDNFSQESSTNNRVSCNVISISWPLSNATKIFDNTYRKYHKLKWKY